MYRKRKSSIEQALLLNRDIDTETGCWNWTGYCSKIGYGSININNKVCVVHRIAYELWVEPIPEGIKACHHCDNPSCFNPEHIFLGTQKDNVQDCMNKGRMNRAKGELHGRCKLTPGDVLAIRWLHTEGKTTTQLGNIFNVKQPQISRIVLRENWKHI